MEPGHGYRKHARSPPVLSSRYRANILSKWRGLATGVRLRLLYSRPPTPSRSKGSWVIGVSIPGSAEGPRSDLTRDRTVVRVRVAQLVFVELSATRAYTRGRWTAQILS